MNTSLARPIRLAIVEDNPLFLDLVATSLEAVGGFAVVAKAKSATEARAVLTGVDVHRLQR